MLKAKIYLTILANAIALTAVTSGCNSGGSSSVSSSSAMLPGGFYNSSGVACGNTPSPGCDYNPDGTKIDAVQDPTYQTFIDSSYGFFVIADGTLNGSIWTSPDGVEYGNCGGDYGCGSTGSLAINSFEGGAGTKDTDLQKANIQTNDINSRAAMVANQFQMSVQKATQLVQIAQKVQAMTANGQPMTAADRTAVSAAAFSVAGVTADQVNEAVSRAMNGDNSQADAVLEKAAQNLGMPSAANLRDKLLPSLGYNLN